MTSRGRCRHSSHCKRDWTDSWPSKNTCFRNKVCSATRSSAARSPSAWTRKLGVKSTAYSIDCVPSSAADLKSKIKNRKSKIIMTQAIVDPDELRLFAQMLKQFNQDLADRATA